MNAPVALETAPAAVRLHGVGVRAGRQWLLRGLHLDIGAGELVAVTGPARGARTLALLAAAGRLRLTEGRLSIHGGARIGLGVVRGVNDLDHALTVADTVRERQALVPVAADPAEVLSVLGLDLAPRRRLSDLPPVELLLLGAGLALLDRPDLLVVDDVDEVGGRDDVDRAWSVLRDVADRGTAVLAGAHDTHLLADRERSVAGASALGDLT